MFVAAASVPKYNLYEVADLQAVADANQLIVVAAGQMPVAPLVGEEYAEQTGAVTPVTVTLTGVRGLVSQPVLTTQLKKQ